MFSLGQKVRQGERFGLAVMVSYRPVRDRLAGGRGGFRCRQNEEGKEEGRLPSSFSSSFAVWVVTLAGGAKI